tara:strand:+ start:109 stop:444 length:336 start_codon:yes stop_codon:yes gene_type:complete
LVLRRPSPVFTFAVVGQDNYGNRACCYQQIDGAPFLLWRSFPAGIICGLSCHELIQLGRIFSLSPGLSDISIVYPKPTFVLNNPGLRVKSNTKKTAMIAHRRSFITLKPLS